METLRLRSLLDRVPDVPRLVETRSMLLGGECLLFGRPAEGHAVIVDRDGRLASVVGRPAAHEIARAAASLRGELLVEEAGAAHVAAALPDWNAEGAVIHAWPRAVAPAGGAPVTRLLQAADGLDHLPPEVREEIEDARTWTAVVVACSKELPVAFCYAGSETETLWDVSIDTLAPYRRRGFACAAFLFMAGLQRAWGRSPVWGALDSNVASLGLAAALGFVPVDRLMVFSRKDLPAIVPPRA